jgi:SNF2 family DNA or RNA helicase
VQPGCDLADCPALYEPLLRRLQDLSSPNGASGNGTWGSFAAHLMDQAIDIWARPGFDRLVSLPRLRFEPFDYQLRATETVLGRMRGRAILADEVGLGKTIEAGLVLSELRLRGLASRALVLAPTGLLSQWDEEFKRKFALPSRVSASAREWSRDQGREDDAILIASLAAARRAPLKDDVVETEWDVVVVDEAHRLKNPATASARLVRSLRSRYLLLLTATPVENRLGDLFQLVSLVAPGLLGTPKQFRARHGASTSPTSQVRELHALRECTREVMVRHRRSEVALRLPRRLAKTVRINPRDDEAELYQLVSERVRHTAKQASSSARFALRNVQRLAGSSPGTLAPTLEGMGWGDLADRARRLPSTDKARALVELLERHLARSEKVAVFTAFRQTLTYLAETAEGAGIDAAMYHGSLSRRDKETAIERFRDEVPVLLTSEAAGEGRNLQFCHVMINFDLPWNPMQIEQRLGRIHRIGQRHDVLLVNLLCRGTIEEHIASVLEAKINLFELVVGELDMILGRIEDDFDFESSVFRAHAESADDEDFAARLDALGDELHRARRDYLDSGENVDALVGESP